MRDNVYDRNTLYKEVWESPMRDVAGRYGISDVMLKKICGHLSVPTPPRGYWAKIRAGQGPKPKPLPPSDGPHRWFGKGFERNPRRENSFSELDEIIEPAEAAFINQISESIEYREGVRLRANLIALRKSGDFPEKVRRINQPQNYAFAEMVSKCSSKQALACIELLTRAAEQIGGAVSESFTFHMLGESIKLEVLEEAKRIEHTITAKEAQELKRYEESRWYKPSIRKWDYEFTGLMKFNISAGFHFPYPDELRALNAELTQKRTEDLSKLLAKVFHAMCTTCAVLRELRHQKTLELEQYKNQVEALRQQVKSHNSETAKFNSVMDEARRREDARLLREYAKALKESGEAEAGKKAGWIEEKANWVDPLTASTDAIFGRLNPGDYPPSEQREPSDQIPYSLSRYFENNGSLPDPSLAKFRLLIAEKCGEQ